MSAAGTAPSGPASSARWRRCGIEPNPDDPGPLADAALDGNAGQFELGHDTGREIDARGTQLGIAHRRAGGATQCVEHELLLMVTSFKCGRRRTGFYASVPGSPGVRCEKNLVPKTNLLA